MSERRVVITGSGIISPCGITIKDFYNNIFNGISGLTLINKDHPDMKDLDIHMCGRVKNWNAEDHLSKRDIKRLNVNGQFVTYAAKKAFEQSGLEISNINLQRAGVIMGAVFGGWDFLEQQYIKFKEKGGKRISPLSIPKLSPNTMISVLTIIYGFMGPSYSVNAACASATIGIGEAFMKIRSGELDLCLSGGVDAEMSPFMFHAFNNMKALSKKKGIEASSPFTLNRDGFVLSEGAACLILEEYDYAKKRGANILAEIVGYGSSSDGYHITRPHPEGKGASLAMNKALQMSGLNPCDIDYINAHGTGTYFNDKVETLAMKEVFGKSIHDISISSTKSMTGHLLGAAGGIEAIVLLLALQNDLIPPTINFDEKDPELDLDYTPNYSKEKKLDIVMSNSLGFGGQNGSLIFKKI